MSEKIKIDRALVPRKKVDVKAIAVYSGKFTDQIISSIERGEKPQIQIYLNWNERRRVPEIAFVFAGEHRLEKYSYFKKDPKQWINWGRIIASPEQAAELMKKLGEVLEYCWAKPEATSETLEAFMQELFELRAFKEDIERQITPQIWRDKGLSKLEKLRRELTKWGVNPDEVLKEEGAKKLAGMLKAWKRIGPKPRPSGTYEFTEKEMAEIYRAKIKELKQVHG